MEGGKPHPPRSAQLPAKEKEGQQGGDSRTTTKPGQLHRGVQPFSQATSKGTPTGPAHRIGKDQPAQPEDAQPERAAHQDHTAGERPGKKTFRTRRRTPPPGKWQSAGHIDTDKAKKRKPKEGGRGGGNQGGQHRKRRQGPPQSHNTTGPRTTPTDPPPRSQESQERKKTYRGGRNPAHGDPHTTPNRRRPHLGEARYWQCPHECTRRSRPAKISGVQARPKPKHTHHKPQPALAGEAKTGTQTHTP